MFKFFWKLFHEHEWTPEIVVSGYGYTQYAVRFCKHSDCMKGEVRITQGQQ